MTDLPGKVIQDGAVEVRYFPVTGHTIRYGFRAFWEKFGNLVLFGYPISEEFVQPNGVTVQYFERARFEWSSTYTDHPERFNVRLGLVGSEVVTASSVASTLPTLNNPFYRREL